LDRHTKIIATLGPGVASPERVRSLVAAGVDVARLNFSHGDHETHRNYATWVREAARAEGRVVALLQDIQGPKLRVGRFPGGRVSLEDGSTVRLYRGREMAAPGTVQIDYEFLLDDLEAGERVLLADGLICLEVEGKQTDHLSALVIQGGELTDGKGVAFPSTALRAPAVTEKDRVDLEFGRELEVDFVAASFVRSGADVKLVRELSGGAPVIAKIELAAAYDNLDDILAEASGAMVARGDLGVQLPLERIPLVQADILRRTNAAGLISITATEMLESMTHSPRPTRAEVTDVANAVLAGTDAVMLSAETATGAYPMEAVKVMARICSTFEESMATSASSVSFLQSHRTFASATAQAAVEASANLGIDTIVAFTETGNTARLLSKYRPAARIIAFTSDPRTLNRMALYWGVIPTIFARRDYTDVMIAAAEKYLEKEGICRRGEGVVMVAGIPPNQKASTNLMKLHVVGERDRSSQVGRSSRPNPVAGGFSR